MIMSTERSLSVCLCALLAMAGSASWASEPSGILPYDSRQKPTPPPAAFTSEDSAVLDALLRARVVKMPAILYPIALLTSTDVVTSDSQRYAEKELLNHGVDRSRSTLISRAFLRRNAQSRTVQPVLKTRVTLLSPTDVYSAFAPRYYSLTFPAYDPDRTLALIRYAAAGVGLGIDTIHLACLRRDSGVWRLAWDVDVSWDQGDVPRRVERDVLPSVADSPMMVGGDVRPPVVVTRASPKAAPAREASSSWKRSSIAQATSKTLVCSSMGHPKQMLLPSSRSGAGPSSLALSRATRSNASTTSA